MPKWKKKLSYVVKKIKSILFKNFLTLSIFKQISIVCSKIYINLTPVNPILARVNYFVYTNKDGISKQVNISIAAQYTLEGLL